MSVERLLQSVVCYVAYVGCTIGLAFSLGAPIGWVVGLVAAALPGGYLLSKQVEQVSLQRERQAYAPERLRPPGHYAPRDAGPAPEALSPPQ